MKEKDYKELLGKIDTITKLLAAQIVGDKKGREAISFLASLGFRPKEIAQLIGTTPNTVRVALSKMKRKSGEKKDE